MSVVLQLLPFFPSTFFNTNGSLLAGGQLYSYAAGTSTPLATFSDAGGVTPNTNPIILNSSGQASIFLGAGLGYKFVLFDSLGNQLALQDSVYSIPPKSVTKQALDSSVAGVGLAQAGDGSLEVVTDGATTDVNGSNQVEVKDAGISYPKLAPSMLLEATMRRVRDLTNPGSFEWVPQLEWLAPSKLSNPVTIPGGGTTLAKFSPNGEFLAVNANPSPGPALLIYQRAGSTFNYLSAALDSAPLGLPYDFAWSPCGDFLAVVCAHATTALIIYQRTGNAFTTLKTVSLSQAPSLGNVAWSQNSDFLVFNSFGTSTVTFKVYERNGTTFTDVTVGTGIDTADIGANPFAWAHDSSMFAGLNGVNSKILVYSRADAVFTLLSTIDTSAYAGNIGKFKFSPDGNLLTVILTVTPFILNYQYSGGIFTLLASPGTLPPDVANGLCWSLNSEYLVIFHNTSPFMTIYQVTGASTTPVFTKISNPSSLPVAALTGGDFSSTKQFLAAGTATTPYIQIYKTASAFPTNGLLWTRGVNNG